MPTSSLLKKSQGIIQPIAGRESRVNTFFKDICSKLNVKARLKFELVTYIVI